MTQVLLPKPGAPKFWQDHMGEWADRRGYGRDHLFTLQLKPRQLNGCEGTFALGRLISHGNLEWNEQGAIVISVRRRLTPQLIRLWDYFLTVVCSWPENHSRPSAAIPATVHPWSKPTGWRGSPTTPAVWVTPPVYVIALSVMAACLCGPMREGRVAEGARQRRQHFNLAPSYIAMESWMFSCKVEEPTIEVRKSGEAVISFNYKFKAFSG
jgi:hypothetical protein